MRLCPSRTELKTLNISRGSSNPRHQRPQPDPNPWCILLCYRVPITPKALLPGPSSLLIQHSSSACLSLTFPQAGEARSPRVGGRSLLLWPGEIPGLTPDPAGRAGEAGLWAQSLGSRGRKTKRLEKRKVLQDMPSALSSWRLVPTPVPGLGLWLQDQKKPQCEPLEGTT